MSPHGMILRGVGIKRDTSLWQSAEPCRKSCCICMHSIDPGNCVIEERPTGQGGRHQFWAYCKECWSQSNEPPLPKELLLFFRRFGMWNNP